MATSYSTQANFDSVKNADAHAQGIDGGLNLKTDPGRLAPPATTRADNALYLNPGSVRQAPAPASVMQANTKHVYNLHARDTQAPSTLGDLMVHGEVLDAAGSTTNLWTSPVWTDGNGSSVNTQQPMPPWQQRTRILTGKLNVAGTGTTDLSNMLMARQEAGYSATSPRRYALGYYDGTNLNVTFGIIDGQVELNTNLTVALTADYVEMAGVQGTSNFAVMALNGTAIAYTIYDFNGNVVTAATTLPYANMAYNGAASGTYQTATMFQHAGRSFIAYIGKPTGSTYQPALYDIVAQTNTFFTSATSTVPAQGFACSSPYGYTTPTGTLYFGMLYNGSVYVLSQATNTSAPSAVGTAVALSVAASTGYASGSNGTNTVNFAACLNCNVFDTNGGSGSTASLGFTVFRHYPEQVTGYGSSTFWYQQVSADRIQFAASSSTLTSIGQKVFRTPSGAQICSKAFNLFPSRGGGMGMTQAKSSYVLVRCGASEPQANFSGNYSGNIYNNWWSYGQPTYFIIDHQARVVSRLFEAGGPPACGYTLSNNGYYISGATPTGYGTASQVRSLGQPLVVPSNSDLSAVDIVLPAWVQTMSSTQSVYSAGAANYYVGQPSNVIMQPAAIELSLSNQAALPPPVQSGPYSVFSGPMTCIHDGRGVVEANYHFQTQNLIVAITSSTTAPGAGAAGVYYWCVIWEWYDSTGRVHRSAPSAPFPGTVATGSYLTGATVYCPQPVTAKSAVGGVMYARLYRSVLNSAGGVFYLVSTTAISALASGNYFATLVDNGTYLDASTGTTAYQNALVAQPRRYTDLTSPSASVYTYASTPPPCFIWQTASRGRSFGLAQVFGQHRLYYTSIAQDRYPFEWNVYNYAPIPPEVGDVRSIEAIDDKVLIFGTRSNAYIAGTGPATANTSGVPAPGDGYDAILPIPTPQGCVGTGGPCRGPDGIFFQGFSGIQLAARDLTTSAIGAAVDVITGRQINNGGTVYGRGCMLPSLQSVVWPNPAGAALIYNYLTQKWSTWSLLVNASVLVQRLDGAIFAAIQPIANGTYAGLAASSSVGADIVQLGSSYSPVCLNQNAAPGLVLETPWILPSGESGGEAQLWDCTFTGGWLGPHVLQIETCFNYAATYTQTNKFNFAVAPQFYQARVRPSSSRVWAVRYRISLLPSSTLSSSYQMATLSDLVVNFGAKQGTTRLGQATSG